MAKLKSRARLIGTSPKSDPRLAPSLCLAAVALFVGSAFAPPPVNAQGSSTTFTVSIISPANGGGAAGQTLEAGVFAITNNTDTTQPLRSVTIAFSNPLLFSSATLMLMPSLPPGVVPNQRIIGPPSPPTLSPPAVSTTFTFDPPVGIAPGVQPVFALRVKLSAIAERDPVGSVAYASVQQTKAVRGSTVPAWIAFALIAAAIASIPGGRRRRVAGALIIVFVIAALGCGGDRRSASTQTVTALRIAVARDIARAVAQPPAPTAGVPLRLGTIAGE
jgi:hypothetical protein